MKNIIFQEIPIKIVTNILAHSLKLRLDKQGNVILTLPKWVTQRRGLAFVQDNIDWIKTQQAKLCATKTFTHGMVVELLGETLTIVHDKKVKRGVFIQDEKLVVSGDAAHIHRRVRDFIKKQGYAYIQEKSLILAQNLGQKPSKITLRDTSSRWGSCSSRQSLSFCWKLALAPTYVLDYIIAHEVAHLVEMNHSDAFWRTVAKIDTNRASAQSWLRKHGPDIQSWE